MIHCKSSGTRKVYQGKIYNKFKNVEDFLINQIDLRSKKKDHIVKPTIVRKANLNHLLEETI